MIELTHDVERRFRYRFASVKENKAVRTTTIRHRDQPARRRETTRSARTWTTHRGQSQRWAIRTTHKGGQLSVVVFAQSSSSFIISGRVISKNKLKMTRETAKKTEQHSTNKDKKKQTLVRVTTQTDWWCCVLFPITRLVSVPDRADWHARYEI